MAYGRSGTGTEREELPSLYWRLPALHFRCIFYGSGVRLAKRIGFILFPPVLAYKADQYHIYIIKIKVRRKQAEESLMARLKPEVFAGRYKEGQLVAVDGKPAIVVGECRETGYYFVQRRDDDGKVYTWKEYGGRIKHYTYHCWRCHSVIDSSVHATCPACHWVICPECKACRKPVCEDDMLETGVKPVNANNNKFDIDDIFDYF